MTSVSAGVAGSCTQVASATNVQYQWQSSTDNITYTNISGANGASYTHTSALSVTTYFRRAYRTYCDTVYSNVLTATVSGSPQGTPGVHGNGQWNAYVYTGTDYATGYSGWFTTSSAMNQNTTAYYTTGQAPSNASTYLGCQVAASPYSVRFQRTNIPYGLYHIGIAQNDDQVQILINGVVAFTRGTSGTDLPNAWTGTIYPSTLVEIRYNNTGGPGYLNFYFTPATFSVSATPGSITGNQGLCVGQVPAVTMTSVSAGVAGSCTQVASATNVQYQWQSSTDNITYTNISGANGASYTHTSALSVTTYFRRAYRTYCDTVFSNVVTATVVASAQGTPGVFGNGVWNAYVYDENNFTSHSGYYTSGAGLSYNSTSSFANNVPASNATGYQGCQVSIPSQSIRFQRTNFTPGIYRIAMGTNDDGMQIIFNGTVVYNVAGFNNTARPNVWTGFLTNSSQLEINVANGGAGQFQIDWSFSTLPNSPATQAGTIAGNATICSGLTVALTSSVAATVGTCTPLVSNAYQWQSSMDNISFNNISGANAATYTTPALTQTTYFRRVYRTYCDTVFSNVVTITVNPRPVMTSSNAVSICHNSAVNLTLTSDIASTYSWVATANGNVAGESTSAQPSALINNILVLNTPSSGTTVVYTVTPTATGSGCVGTAQTVNVTVNPVPTMTSTSSLNRCNGLAVNLALTSNIAANYSWIASDNGNVSGESLSAQLGATLSDVLTSSANTNQVVSYQVTPSHTINGCAGATQTVNVTVFPTATMTSVSSLTRCSGTAIGLSLTSNVSGATFSWVATDNSNTTGESLTAQIAATLNNTITNVSGSAQNVVYTITPRTPGALVCAGTPQTFTATINPAPVMTSASTFQACNNTAVGFGLTANPASTFSWIATANGNVGGESNSSAQSGATLTDVLVLNNNLSPTTVNYNVTPTASGTGCIGANQVVGVTVNSTPSMTSASSATICSGNAVSISLTSNVASNFSWIAADNANTTGESLTAQSGFPMSNTLVNNLQTAQNVLYTVTPTNPLGSCVGPNQTVTVTVNPAPVLTNSLALDRCNNVAIGVGLTANPASTFSWIATNNPNTTGESLSSQTGATINNTLVLSDNLVPATVNYSVTPTATGTGCVGAATTVAVTVNSTPSVTSASTTSVCTGVALNFGLTANVASNFSWVATNNANVSGESLSAQAGATVNNTLANLVATPQNVNYTITPTNPLGGCVGPNQSLTVTVIPNVGMPSAPSGTTTFCQGSTIPFSTSATNATDYTWSVSGAGNTISGSGISVNAVFDVNFNGSALVSVQALGCGGPSSTASTSVTVNPNGMWLGSTTNWNTGSNWCGGVPTSTTNVLIPTDAVNMPQITANSFAQNISLQIGTSLAVNGSNGLTISGMFSNSGTFSPASTSTVTYNGNGAQNIISANYGNLSTSGTGTKTLVGTIGISGTFSPSGSSHDAGASTVNFNGTAAQNIPAFTFNNLSISGNSAKNMTGNVSVNGVSTLTNGTLAIGAHILNLGGSISGSGTLTGSCASTLTISGPGATGTLNFTAGSRILGTFNLSKSASGDVQLGNDLDICTALNLTQGKVIIGANNLTLLSGASTTNGNANSYVQCLDQKEKAGAGFFIRNVDNGSGNLIFPIGTPTSYNPAYLDNIGFSRTFRARIFNEVYEYGVAGDLIINLANSVRKSWEIEPTTGTGDPNVAITLQWNLADEGPRFSETRQNDKFYLGKNSGIGNSLWTKMITADSQTTTSPFYVTGGRISSFSIFSIGSEEEPLPVSMGNLSVKSNLKSNVLSWKTYSERESKGFEVLRSSDGQTFEAVGFVKAAGTSTQVLDYQFEDPNSAARLYYKIRFIGLKDGDEEFSNVVVVRKTESVSIQVFPNPTTKFLNIQMLSDISENDISFQMVNMKGASFNPKVEARENGKYCLDVDFIPQGLYLLKVFQSGLELSVLKLVKQ
jgi:hypothetical protein